MPSTIEVTVGPWPRGIAISHDGLRILVARFISPVDKGEVIEVDGPSMTVVRTFELAFDSTPDTESGGRGVPNYLFSPTISPDGLMKTVKGKPPLLFP